MKRRAGAHCLGWPITGAIASATCTFLANQQPRYMAERRHAFRARTHLPSPDFCFHTATLAPHCRHFFPPAGAPSPQRAAPSRQTPAALPSFALSPLSSTPSCPTHQPPALCATSRSQFWPAPFRLPRTPVESRASPLSPLSQSLQPTSTTARMTMIKTWMPTAPFRRFAILHCQIAPPTCIMLLIFPKCIPTTTRTTTMTMTLAIQTYMNKIIRLSRLHLLLLPPHIPLPLRP